jgi:excisionase family DNA binding protein
MLLNVKQVANYLSLSKSKVYQMASSGDLPCVKFGDCIRFKAEEIDNFISDNVKNEKDKSISYFNPNSSFNTQYLT